MSAGYRSPLAIWVGGAGTAGAAPPAPIPEGFGILKTLLTIQYKVPTSGQPGGWGSAVSSLILHIIDLLNSWFISTNKVRHKYPVATATLASGATLSPGSVSSIARVSGSGGPVTLNATTAIADGEEDGQLLILVGTHATNTVTVNDAANTDLGANRTLALGSVLALLYNDSRSLWEEMSWKS